MYDMILGRPPKDMIQDPTSDANISKAGEWIITL